MTIGNVNITEKMPSDYHLLDLRTIIVYSGVFCTYPVNIPKERQILFSLSELRKRTNE